MTISSGTGDTLAAVLAESKRIADGLQFACRRIDATPDFTACGGPAAEAYWEHFTPARVSALLAAVEAALKLHRPIDRGRVMNCCEGCEMVNGEFHEDCCHEWPCPTYGAITSALTGKEAGDARQ
jgi:hypothetical protein